MGLDRERRLGYRRGRFVAETFAIARTACAPHDVPDPINSNGVIYYYRIGRDEALKRWVRGEDVVFNLDNDCGRILTGYGYGRCER